MKTTILKISLLLITFFYSAQSSLAQKNNFIKGADGSLINEVEDAEGKYFVDGSETDVLQIFRDNGFNYIRLKLWHTPENEYNSLPNVMEMAKRAKNMGFGLLIDFHYSDTWADPGHQTKPSAWNGLAFNVLSDSIYEYTKYVIAQLKSQNTLPDMVQIGNEITCGMLWDDGRVCNPWDTNQQWNKLGTLIKNAINGMNAALDDGEDIQVILHFANGANNSACRWWFDNIMDEGVDFDIIGLSYYPWWHGTLTELKNNLNDLSTRYEKDIMVVEGGYPWTLDWNDNVNNIVGLPEQLHAGYPATVEGQTSFLMDLMDIIQQTSGNRGKGFMYWSPEWVSAPQLGSPWENVSLFDFNNEVLESIKVFNDQSGIGDGRLISPIRLNNPYPNPFHTETKIAFTLKVRDFVELLVYDVSGKQIASVINENMHAGEHSVTWSLNGHNAGIYYIVLQSDGFSQVKKVVVY